MKVKNQGVFFLVAAIFAVSLASNFAKSDVPVVPEQNVSANAKQHPKRDIMAVSTVSIKDATTFVKIRF